MTTSSLGTPFLQDAPYLGPAAVALGIPSGAEFSGHLLVPLREGADFTLYRGRQDGNPSPVLVVAITGEQPSPQSLRRLEHEYSLVAELNPVWAAQPLALDRYEGRTILVLRDPGGEPLDLILERNQGQPLELTRVLRIAISLTTALGQVHRRGLIHKDIKPENVLVDDDDHVWLTGFGIASWLLRGHPPVAPEIIAGTLAYMAPEQTGRMNRSIDTTSDLYSLGVTLYQMLTGNLPFAAADAMEWVHCHIARQPAPPDTLCDIPTPVSDIVMRLMAKTAEERYQTAEGLEADLRHCLSELEMQDRVDPFPLGTHDIVDRLLIPERLYGRDREVKMLLAAFDRVVANGTPELVLVSGYAGVGKSTVVNELQKVLIAPLGLFAAGKFDQYKRDIPYETLSQAFQTLVRQILVKKEAEVDQWRQALAKAVGPNGQVIIDLIPELEFILGKQSPVPDLPPLEAQNRFQRVFRRFLNAFATREHPLALFVDDLQWLDDATLDLFVHLVTHSEVKYLLLIGAYRDNEVDSSHRLLRTLEAIRSTDTKLLEIVLTPLKLDDVNRLVSGALHCTRLSTHPLAELVHEKTGGNPFFVIQFLTVLVDEELLSLDQIARAWRWDMNRIRAKGYTDSVVDLMVGKMKRLSAGAQKTLKELACLGSVVEVATLALVHEGAEEMMHTALSEAVGAGLIYPDGSSYRFLHDRIQQAGYSLIPQEDYAEVHLAMGRLLLAKMTTEKLAEHLFDVVNHFNRGATLLVEDEERLRVAAINLRAGRKANASAAYASARAYFSDGMALLDESDWVSHDKLMFSLALEWARAELLIGNPEKCQQIIDDLLRHRLSKVDTAAVYQLKVQSHFLKAEYSEAVASALTCLCTFGIDIQAHPTWEDVQAASEEVWQSLDGRPLERLIDLPLIADPELQADTQVLSALVSAAFNTDIRLWCVVVSRVVKIGIEHGTSEAFAHAYCNWGAALGHFFHRFGDAVRLAKLACDLVDKRGFIACGAKVHLAKGCLAFFTQPIAAALDCMRTVIRTGVETGDLTFACIAQQQSVTALLLRNDPLDMVWRESETALRFVCEAKIYGDFTETIECQRRFIATMQGRTANLSTFNDAQFDEKTYEAQLTGKRMPKTICWYWILKLKARFLSGDYPEALAAAEKAQSLLAASVTQIQLLDYFYYFALTVAACYENVPADQQQAWDGLLARHVEQLREWAENNPSTFADKHTLVSAEIARLERRDSDAMRLYEQAINLARENGFIQNEALTHELAARFYAERDVETVAHSYLRSARNGYDRWGAHGKVRQLDARHPRLRGERHRGAPSANLGTALAQLNVETVVRASQALSSEIVLPKLIETLMRLTVEHAGAERGLLILLREDEPQIEAEAITSHERAAVTVWRTAVTPLGLPQSVLHYVIRTRERVLLDDASVENFYSQDEYLRLKHPRSVLCVPIVKQSKLVGVLYLENNLTPRAFTSDRVAVLELLAAQAAISLENAGLYSDLQRSEAFLARGQSVSHTGSFGWSVASGELYWSAETYNIFEHDRTVKPTLEMILRRTHPDDRDLVLQTLDRASEARADFDLEHRLLMPNGSVKHLHVSARVVTTTSGNLEFVGAVTDVTAAKQAEEKSRQDEHELRRITDAIPHIIVVLNPDGRPVYVNRVGLEYMGLSLEEMQAEGSEHRVIHHEDIEKSRGVRENALLSGVPFECEQRLLRKDGTCRWFLIRYNSFRDEQGRLVRWYATGTDIEDRKLAEQRLQNENVALREEVDRVSMFDEIVGASTSLSTVLARVAKVAPVDSTVLITGETGTGKELIARAIHKRSRRAQRAFVSVNCAALAPSLISSELFGHEKGAFTGATQRRVGRFESANGGTLFLDEVGELPLDTQIALLRVLQEREFERVGGKDPIKVDVRIIAATNRDLNAAQADGTFRSDLFFRLNVFPIQVPPLRERRDDIAMLLEYFLDRYAKQVGKVFRSIDKHTLDFFRDYEWPGNIRELQNVIERSVILSPDNVFCVDNSWLPSIPRSQGKRKMPDDGNEDDSQRERDMIESALAQSRGRIAGPTGAASILGMNPSTLDSRIKKLNIRKKRFKLG
jgi:PAS domain S-box-containing protein